MVERYRRGKGKRKLLGNHQKCWIWGRNLVTETLRAGRWIPVDLLLSQDVTANLRQPVVELAESLDVPFELVEPNRIRQLCGTAEHQGFAARMPDFPYTTVDELPGIVAGSKPVLLLICDRIQDPYNFGAILRSADCFGVDAVVIQETQQVGVTSLVARSSAGAVNTVPIVRHPSLPALATELAKLGVALAACSEKAVSDVAEADLAQAIALVVGNEGTGVRPELQEAVDIALRIPMHGSIGSLNAMVAASVTLYEAQRQRHATAG